MPRRESSIEASCRRAAERADCALLKLWPIIVGIPDRILMGPNRLIAFVELKRPGKVPTAIQDYWHRRLRKWGFVVLVISDLEDFKLQLQSATDKAHNSPRRHSAARGATK